MTTPQRPMVRLKTEVNSPLALEILSVKIEVDGFLDRERPHFVVKNQFNRMMIIVSQNQPHLWFWVEINDLRGIWSLKLVRGYPTKHKRQPWVIWSQNLSGRLKIKSMLTESTSTFNQMGGNASG